MADPISAPAPAEGGSPVAPVDVAPVDVAPAAPAPVAAPVVPVPSGEARTPEGDAKPSAGAPEKYDLKSPEGYTFDADSVKKFEGLARELGYSQEEAQDFVDLMAGEMQGDSTRQLEAWKQQGEAWLGEVKADKELGGKNFERTMSRTKAFSKILDPSGQFGELIDALGIGNNPVFVRGFEKLGRLMEDDGPVESSGSRSGGASMAQRFYPGMNP